MAKHWGGIAAVEIHLVANATGALGSIEAEHPGETVLRMLGEYAIQPTSAPTAADAVIITMGIAVVSTDAVAAGAFPDPFGEPEYPWLYWASHPFHFPDTVLESGQGVGALRRSFDVRSMRKMKPRESLAFVVEYADIAGTPPMTVLTGSTRVLSAQ